MNKERELTNEQKEVLKKIAEVRYFREEAEKELEQLSMEAKKLKLPIDRISMLFDITKVDEWKEVIKRKKKEYEKKEKPLDYYLWL